MEGNITDRDMLQKDILSFSCLGYAPAAAIWSKGLYKIFWINFMPSYGWTK